MAEQELNRYWKTVVNTIQDGVMIVDTEGIIVFINPAFEKITGYCEKDIIASHALNLAVMPVRYQDEKVNVNGACCSGRAS